MSHRDHDGRPDLRLIAGEGQDSERDPIDALAEVLAGSDGDVDQARHIAQSIVEPGAVPPSSSG